MPEPEITAAVPHESRMRRVFVGPGGLHAGWRLLIFLTLLTLFFSVGVIFLQPRIARRLGTEFSATNVILGEGITFCFLLIATAIMGKFERRTLAEYGLPFRLILGKQFWMGALWGFVMLSLIIVLMDAGHAYSPGGLALAPFAILKFGLLWGLGFLRVVLFEEFAFRGYLQFTLTTGMGFCPAAAITCDIFAGLHLSNPGENLVGVVEIVLIAFFLCLALRRTGNLWFAIGWHMAFDWGESFFYSTPNSGIHATGHLLNASLMGSKWLSGGSVGPEASVFDVVVTVAGILLLAKLYPAAKYPALAARSLKTVAGVSAAPPVETA